MLIYFRLILAILTISVVSTSVEAAQEAASGFLYTRDNVKIAYEHYKNGSDSVIIVCPGFYNSKNNRWMRKTVEMLSTEYDVIIFDFRGHGQSGGTYTWSAKEEMDVDAVIDYAKACGYKKLGILAYSLGAAAAINDVANRDGDVKSMVLISCPSKFNAIDFHFWEPAMLADLKDNIDCGWEGKGARVNNIFLQKENAIDNISKLDHTALLIIQGDRDWVVNERHARKLFDAAHGVKELAIIKGGLHAERLVEFQADVMRTLILDWFSKTLGRMKNNMQSSPGTLLLYVSRTTFSRA